MNSSTSDVHVSSDASRIEQSLLLYVIVNDRNERQQANDGICFRPSQSEIYQPTIGIERVCGVIQ
jgi:hypothetical protein